jgi:hypothetical protein
MPEFFNVEALLVAQVVLASLPPVVAKPNPKGLRHRYVIGQQVVLVDARGPVPLKIGNINSNGVRLEALSAREISDFMTKVRMNETLIAQRARQQVSAEIAEKCGAGGAAGLKPILEDTEIEEAS